MPWFIIRPGRMPVADHEPFPSQAAAAELAARRYPDIACQIVEADTTMQALRQVIDAAQRPPGRPRDSISPRLRVEPSPPPAPDPA